MITEHLSEQEIQQFALDNSSCDKKTREHVQVCQHCSAQAQTYQLLFTAIKALPQAVFDFNLADRVMEKLPQPKKSLDNLFIYFILGLVFLSFGFVYYFLGRHLPSLFIGMAPLTAYLIIITASSILGFLCMDSYNQFLKQTKKLDYF